MTRALITGITGQDGSYLTERLLALGYEVHGTVRPGGAAIDGVTTHEVDLAGTGAGELVTAIAPDEIYNLAAVSSVFRSWQEPALTAHVNGGLVAELLAAVRDAQESLGKSIRFIQASSAEIFGMPVAVPQTESTAVHPTSPYGAAKAYAHHLVGVYRAAGVAASSCILYNHESPRRPEAFVTRKITAAAARISLGKQDMLTLGNLDARRDWGWAPDYVEALHKAALAETPGDYVIATGSAHSVEDFVRLAFSRAGIEDWEGHVRIADDLRRTGDAHELVGDATKARDSLDWAPTLDFEAIVAAMVDHDLEVASSMA